MPEIKPAALEAFMSLVVHDLRNPAATLGANLSFVREVLDDPSVEREEIGDALADAQQALHDLQLGFDQLSWIGRWFNGSATASVTVEPVYVTFQRVEARIKYGALQVEAPAPELAARGGDALERLLEVLIVNGHQHAPRSLVKLRARESDDELVVEVEDAGRPLAPELRALAFTLEGQASLKGRSDGRYGRMAGLLAAGALADTLGARLDAIERDRRNVFRVALARV